MVRGRSARGTDQPSGALRATRWLSIAPSEGSAVSKMDTGQDNAGRSAFELHGKEFASGTLFDPIAQSHELRLALVRLTPCQALQIIQRGGADRAGYLLLTVDHRKQDHHPVIFVAAKATACECHFACLLWRALLSRATLTSCRCKVALSRLYH